jgi:hypothetical protein
LKEIADAADANGKDELEVQLAKGKDKSGVCGKRKAKNTGQRQGKQGDKKSEETRRKLSSGWQKGHYSNTTDPFAYD